MSYWHFCLISVPDHLCFRFGANTELHRSRPLVCNLPPADVQEHSQAGPQEYRYNLGRVLCHNDPSSCGDGEQQPATWANQQDQPVYSVWWTLGRFVFTDLLQTHQNIDSDGLVFWYVASGFHLAGVKSRCCRDKRFILQAAGVVETQACNQSFLSARLQLITLKCFWFCFMLEATSRCTSGQQPVYSVPVTTAGNIKTINPITYWFLSLEPLSRTAREQDRWLQIIWFDYRCVEHRDPLSHM